MDGEVLGRLRASGGIHPDRSEGGSHRGSLVQSE